jgi:hypothetical protein
MIKSFIEEVFNEHDLKAIKNSKYDDCLARLLI